MINVWHYPNSPYSLTWYSSVLESVDHIVHVPLKRHSVLCMPFRISSTEITFVIRWILQLWLTTHHLFGKHSLWLISKYRWFWSIWRTAAYISYVFEIRDSVDPPWISGVDRFHDNVMIGFISAWIIKVKPTLWLPWAANISKTYAGLIYKINLAAKAKRRKSMKYQFSSVQNEGVNCYRS